MVCAFVVLWFWCIVGKGFVVLWWCCLWFCGVEVLFFYGLWFCSVLRCRDGFVVWLSTVSWFCGLGFCDSVAFRGMWFSCAVLWFCGFLVLCWFSVCRLLSKVLWLCGVFVHSFAVLWFLWFYSGAIVCGFVTFGVFLRLSGFVLSMVLCFCGIVLCGFVVVFWLGLWF